MSPPRKIPVADFRKGARTSPAFQRGSALAGLDMVNLAVDGQSRPVPRAGYVVDEALTDSAEGLGNQLVRVHDLGNSVREPITRTFRLRSTQSYVVHKGRIFISDPLANNRWINLHRDSIGDTFNLDLPELTLAPTIQRTPQDVPSLFKNGTNTDDGYVAGGRVVSNFFGVAYTFESVEFGFETGLSPSRVIDFPTYNGGWYNPDIQFECYIPNQQLPHWIDRINFYVQTESGVPVPNVNAEFDPKIEGKAYIKFGGIRFTNDNQRNNFDFPSNPTTLSRPQFSWVEGDTVQTPSDDEGQLYPDGRGEYWRAVPTFVGFQGIPTPTILEVANTASGIAGRIHPIVLYGERLWGWDAEEQYLRFSTLGNYQSFPADFAVELSESGQSMVEKIIPAPSVSALFVFKQDAIHIVRGKGQITGLRTKSVANTDLDTSGVILGHGTLSPRTVISGENGIYFISRDKKLKYLTIDGYGNTDVKDVGIAIDEFLAELTLEEQKNLVMFLFSNCLHLIMPDYTLVLDLQKRYWTRLTWELTDAFWSQGGVQSESVLYAIRSHDSYGRFTNDIVRLYEGDTDGGADIPCEWESQSIQLPFETAVTGLVVQHTSEPTELSFELFMDEESVGEFTGIPERSNHFSISCWGYGHVARIRLKSKDDIPLINGLFLEIPA